MIEGELTPCPKYTEYCCDAKQTAPMEMVTEKAYIISSDITN
jgi:hypothetical protein